MQNLFKVWLLKTDLIKTFLTDFIFNGSVIYMSEVHAHIFISEKITIS